MTEVSPLPEVPSRMKSAVRRVQKKVYALPGVGYAVECLVDLATLPRKFRDTEERFGHAERALSALRDVGAPAELARHLPTVLNYITSFAHTSRELTRKQHEVRTALDAMQQSLAATSGSLDKLAADVAALGQRVDQQLGALRERVEFVRVETLFEMMHGRKGAPGRPASALTPKVVNEEKVRAMNGQLRLNLGSGHVPVEGYLNVDRRELPGVDVVAEATHVPFPAAGVQEVFSAHLVEHFPQEELRRVVLPYWYELLAPGGTLRAVLPDWEGMIREYASGRFPFEHLREVTFGGQDYDGDFHYNMFSRDSLTGLLQEAGFRDVTFPVTGRANGKCLEMEVVARK